MKARVRNSKRKIQTMIGWNHDRAFPNMHIDGVLDLSASFDPSRDPILFTFFRQEVGCRWGWVTAQAVFVSDSAHILHLSILRLPTRTQIPMYDTSATIFSSDAGASGLYDERISTLGRLCFKD